MQSGSQQYKSFESSREALVNAAGLDVSRPAKTPRNGCPVAFRRSTTAQAGQRCDLEAPLAASEEPAPPAQSASASILSEGLLSEGAVVVHGIRSSVSLEAVASVLGKFGSIRRVKHIKHPHSKKTCCLVDFSCRGAAQHLIQIGFIRFVDRFLKVSDPRKIARMHPEAPNCASPRATVCVWGPLGRTEVPRTNPRVVQASRPSRARHPAAWPPAHAEPAPKAGGPGRGPSPDSETQAARRVSGADPESPQPDRASGGVWSAGQQEVEVHVEQDIVTTYRIKHRGVIYQQVVQSSNGWFMSSLACPSER